MANIYLENEVPITNEIYKELESLLQERAARVKVDGSGGGWGSSFLKIK